MKPKGKAKSVTRKSRSAQSFQRRSEKTIENILKTAMEEFTLHALAGARVDRIARKTATSKRMIYYHFGNKDGLYLKVLERAYLGICACEESLDLDEMQPAEALRALIGATYNYDEMHEEFVRLVMAENLHQAKFLKKIGAVLSSRHAVIDQLSRILERGRAAGIFRTDLDGVDVHMVISALCFFRVSTRHTFTALFGRDYLSGAAREKYKQTVCDAVLRLLSLH
jgi:AcrR family transcriptional regulator